MDAFDQRPGDPGVPAAHEPIAENPSVTAAHPASSLDDIVGVDADVLPTMTDLDRLAADLDRVDLTLVELDGPVRSNSH